MQHQLHTQADVTVTAPNSSSYEIATAREFVECQLSLQLFTTAPNNWASQSIPLRKCRKCRQFKPEDSFHRNNGLSGGLEYQCKVCRAKKDKVRRIGKQSRACLVTQKECRRCREVKQADCLQRNALAIDCLHSYCKACKKVVDAEARQRKKRKAAAPDSVCDSPQQEAQLFQPCSLYGSGQPHSSLPSPETDVMCQLYTVTDPLSSQAANPLKKGCQGCQHAKPMSEFLPDRHSRDGTFSYCTACLQRQRATPAPLTGPAASSNSLQSYTSGAEDSNHHTAPPQHDAPDVADHKVCEQCSESQPSANFQWDTRYPTSMKCHCRSCHNAAKRRYKQTHTPLAQDVVDRKICRKCQQDKPVCMFPWQRRSTDGLDSHCKACHQQATAGRVAAQGHVQHPTISHKSCNGCAERKAAEDFHHDQSKPDGLRGRCKACEQQTGRVRRAARPAVHTPTVAHKTCRRCRVVKTAYHFGRKAKRSDGLDCYCKACNCKQAAERQHSKRCLVVPASTSRLCHRCGQEKPTDDFVSPKSRLEGMQTCCRACKT